MKLKKLESILENVEVFSDPDIRLEQYATSPHIAARMLHIIDTVYGEINGQFIADFGCGCGVLTLGATLLEAGFCIGIDIDEDALKISRSNSMELQCQNVDFFQADITQMVNPRSHKTFDVVIMNPPFGTKNNKGIDMAFLKTALLLANKSVYSLHKSSTREHIKKKASDWNVKMESIAQLRFDLPRSYKRHKWDSIDIEVDLLRFSFLQHNTVS